MVPYAGAAAHLDAVLWGLVDQDYPRGNVEVIVVECPSAGPRPDAAWRAVRDRFEARWLRHGRPGFAPATARNIGLSVAAGELLVGLDGDVVASPGHLRAHEKAERGASPAVTFGLRRFVRLSGDHVSGSGIHARLGDLPEVAASVSNRVGWTGDWRAEVVGGVDRYPAPYELVLGCNVAVRTDLAREVGGWDETFDGAYGYEDIEFASRLARAGCRVVWEPGATVVHIEDERDAGWKAESRGVNFERACRVIPGFRAHRAGLDERAQHTEGARPSHGAGGFAAIELAEGARPCGVGVSSR